MVLKILSSYGPASIQVAQQIVGIWKVMNDSLFSYFPLQHRNGNNRI